MSEQEAQSNGLKVMVIDDQETMRAIVRQLLREIGVDDVMEADNGKSALKALRDPDLRGPYAKYPDVIICDIYMEPMDGIEFCNAMRRAKDMARLEIPVMILTGEKDEFIHEIARQVGAVDVMVKPVSAQELLGHIQTAIGYQF